MKFSSLFCPPLFQIDGDDPHNQSPKPKLGEYNVSIAMSLQVVCAHILNMDAFSLYVTFYPVLVKRLGSGFLLPPH